MYEAKIFKISLLFKHHPPSSTIYHVDHTVCLHVKALLTAFTLPDVVLIAEVQLTFAKRFQGGDLFQILPAGTDDDGHHETHLKQRVYGANFLWIFR